eukprot:403345641
MSNSSKIQFLKPLIISGPSGCGKSTLINHLLQNHPKYFKLSVSSTTRKPRQGELHGKDYYFTTHDQFEKEIEMGQFLEHNKVHDNWYGTNRNQIIETQKQGMVCVLDIDVKGARDISRQPNFQCNYIFIKTPTIDDLRVRLLARKTETEESLKKRLANAEQEIKLAESLVIYQREFVNGENRDNGFAVREQETHYNTSLYYLIKHIEFYFRLDQPPILIETSLQYKKANKEACNNGLEKIFNTPIFRGIKQEQEHFNQEDSMQQFGTQIKQSKLKSGKQRTQSQNSPRSFSNYNKKQLNFKGQQHFSNENSQQQQKIQATINANKLIINFNNETQKMKNIQQNESSQLTSASNTSMILGSSNQKNKQQQQQQQQQQQFGSNSAMVTPRVQNLKLNERYKEPILSTNKKQMNQSERSISYRLSTNQKLNLKDQPSQYPHISTNQSRVPTRQVSEPKSRLRLLHQDKRDSDITENLRLGTEQNSTERQIRDINKPFNESTDQESLLKSFRGDDDLQKFRQTFMMMGQTRQNSQTKKSKDERLQQQNIAEKTPHILSPQLQSKYSIQTKDITYASSVRGSQRLKIKSPSNHQSLVNMNNSTLTSYPQGKKFVQVKQFQKLQFKRLSQEQPYRRKLMNTSQLSNIMPDINQHLIQPRLSSQPQANINHQELQNVTADQILNNIPNNISSQHPIIQPQYQLEQQNYYQRYEPSSFQSQMRHLNRSNNTKFQTQKNSPVNNSFQQTRQNGLILASGPINRKNVAQNIINLGDSSKIDRILEKYQKINRVKEVTDQPGRYINEKYELLFQQDKF